MHDSKINGIMRACTAYMFMFCAYARVGVWVCYFSGIQQMYFRVFQNNVFLNFN